MIEWAPFSAKALDFIHSSTARLCILHGSVRSSKTVNCSVRWLEYLQSGPMGDLAMIGKTSATLQRNVLNDIFDIVGPKKYHWVNRQQGELNLLGRRVYCFGANNEDAEGRIRGATFAGSLCDEVSLYPQSVFNQLMARMSVRGAQCFCNTNPDSPYHWFYTDYIINPVIVDKQIWHFKMEDNLSLDKDYVTTLSQMYTGVWKQRMIDGLWVAAEGRVYDMFDPALNCIDTARYIVSSGMQPSSVIWYVSCDYGTSTVMTWGLYAKLPNGVVLKVKEYYYNAEKEKSQKADSDFGAIFQRWLGKIYPWIIYCDPSAASWKAELRKRGYRVLDANNDVLNGVRYVGNALTQRTYYIDKACVNTIKEYESYVWDKKAQLKGVDKPLKEHDHTCDGDRYMLYTEALYGMSGVYSKRG